MYVQKYVVGCIYTVRKLAGYRLHHVPADGRSSQWPDNPWVCETQIQAYWLTTSLTRWQMTTPVLMPQSTLGQQADGSCESSKHTRKQRLVAPQAVRTSLLVAFSRRDLCGPWLVLHGWQRKAILRSRWGGSVRKVCTSQTGRFITIDWSCLMWWALTLYLSK
jgi:hypothetical protein